MLVNGRGQVLNPLASDGRSLPPLLIQRDELDKVLARESRSQPVAVLALAPRHDGFVHQVVAEDGGTLRASGCDSFPEASLHIPALLLRELVVPFGNIFLVVAAQAGQIEVQPLALGQLQQFCQAVERLRIGLVRPLQKLAQLQVNANDIGAELLHLGEILLDFGPFRVPVIFEKPPLLIVIIVEAPGQEPTTGLVEDEMLFVPGELHPLHGLVLGPAGQNTGGKATQAQETGQDLGRIHDIPLSSTTGLPYFLYKQLPPSCHTSPRLGSG